MKTPVANDLAMAARTLLNGGIVVYPTETFYAIGCRADVPAATRAIFRLKGRDRDKPMPLLAASLRQAGMAVDTGAIYPGLAARFWPGPLTMLLPGRGGLAPLLLNAGGEAAIRVSGYEPARCLADLAGFPITCSSANFSGQPPANKYNGLDPEFLAEVAGGGPDCFFWARDNPHAASMPSTICKQVADGEERALLVLRQGAVERAALEAAGFVCVNAD